MREIYLGIKFSLSYFTILPVRFAQGDDLSRPRVLASMLLFLPLIGVILCAFGIGIFLALEPLGWFAAIVASIAYMALYGFLHTEAVIDVADAVYAAHSGKDPYPIIKDPTVGAMGVLYGVSFFLLKIASFSTLLMHHLFWPLIMIVLISRLGLLWLVKTREFRSAFVSQLQQSLDLSPLIVLSALYAAAGFWVLGWPFAPLLGCGIAIAFFLSFLMQKSLGFVNGDVLGASLEGVELSLMIVMLALWS